LAARDFVLVTDLVVIDVKQAVTRTIFSRCRIGARAIVICGCGIVIAGGFIDATRDFVVVANAIGVAIFEANPIAIVSGDWSGPIANSAFIVLAHARIYIVTNTVRIGISSTCAATYAERIQLVTIAVAVSGWEISTTAVISIPWTVANTAHIELSNARIYIIANSICIYICSATSSTVS
jgi:hypothetical protein